MTSGDGPVGRSAEEPVGIDELCTLFLFEALDEAQLTWLAERGHGLRLAAEQVVAQEGSPATHFVVLLDGTVTLNQRVRGGSELELARTDHRGAYIGVDAFLTEREVPVYTVTMRAVTAARVFRVPVAEFEQAVQKWFPMAMHLVSGTANGMRATQRRVEEQERLVALGELTAGLTHELNNPAAAAVRAVAALREREAATWRTLATRAARVPGPLGALLSLVLRATDPDRTADLAASRSPLEVSDAEDALTDWLDEHDVPGADDLAAVFVAAGLDADWAQQVVDAVGEDYAPAALAWLAYAVESPALLAEVDEATRRISELVASAKQYSQLDRTPLQRVDLHELLDSTLTVLRHKIGPAMTVVREYDENMPPLEVYAAELNQVWTNLIDNALDAMAGSGTLTVRTGQADNRAVVEICDTGPGVPAEIRDRLFEPFFTTKPVGQGTGLGLDISRRIVVERHGGDLRVESAPGDTRFQVRLPMRPGP